MYMKKILIAIIVILCLCVLNANVIAGPVVDEITFVPSNPPPVSSITFTAKLSGANIDEVYIIVKECKGDFCFALGFNESMDEIASGQYQKEITLNQPDATNIQYWLIINSDGTWYDFQDEYTEVDLSLPSDGNGGGGDDSGNAPGFELLIMFLSIAILAFIVKRKRDT